MKELSKIQEDIFLDQPGMFVKDFSRVVRIGSKIKLQTENTKNSETYILIEVTNIKNGPKYEGIILELFTFTDPTIYKLPDDHPEMGKTVYFTCKKIYELI